MLVAGCATTSSAPSSPSEKPAPPAPSEATPSEAAPPAPETAAETADSPEAQRKALAELFGREADPVAEQEVTGAAFHLKIEGRSPPKVEPADEGQEVVTTDLGFKQPISCIVAPAFASATTFHQVVTNIAATMTVRAARVREIDHVNGDPILHGEILYAPPSRPRSIGLVKVAVASGSRGGLLCTHDEPGYAKTFARVVKGAYASMELQDAEPEPESVWSELQVVRVQDTVAGYERRDLYPTQDKGLVLVIRGTAAFFPSLNEALAMDSRSEEFSDPAGVLTSQKFVQITKGEVTTEVELERSGKGQYSFRGTHDGQPVNGTLSTQGQTELAHELSLAKLGRTLLAAKKPTERSVQVYNPGEDPTVLKVTTLKTGPTPGLILTRSGANEARNFLEQDGTVKRQELVGPANIAQERVFQSGTWPAK
ncbi:MAG: hypothetical protein M3Y59_16405 [Myxococcota bacterium]|nr:hypothetical protein [Myxococcota bacterium]